MDSCIKNTGEKKGPIKGFENKWENYFIFHISEQRKFVFQESESESCSVMSDSLRPNELYSLWNSPGQNTGVGSCSLYQGNFATQESNPDPLHCRLFISWVTREAPCFKKETANHRDQKTTLMWPHCDLKRTIPGDCFSLHILTQYVFEKNWNCYL